MRGFLTTITVALVIAVLGVTSAEKDFPALDHIVPSASPETQTKAAYDLIKRLVPDHASKFSVLVDPSIGPKFKDTFRITNGNGSIHITGTTGVGVAMGFYFYIKKFCNAHVSWAGDQVNLPDVLPAVTAAGITVTSNDRLRYYLNVCTVSYSMVWWTWARWEKEIDWMAMNGINFPLAFNGQEGIWNRVYLKMGFNQSELDAHFAGPGFLAWERMGNMEAWGGPLSDNWHTQQMALQHQILTRMRSVGIIPILPAFAGHVPKAIKRVIPDAKTYQLSDWNHFGAKNGCTTFLEPTDPSFKKIGKAFLDEYIKEFGTDHVYNCDSFNEMVPRSSDPSYVKGAGYGVYEGMIASDPDAVWVMQGWLFYMNKAYWHQPQVEALLTSVPIGRMIILDLYSEVEPMYQNYKSFYGQPFIWNMLHNFGGSLPMYGAIEAVNNGPFKGRAFPNSTMIGIGLTPEAINQNDVIYEFMMENTWRKQPANLSEWFSNYGSRRYGKYDSNIAKGWQLMMRSVLNCTDGQESHGHGRNVIVLRPAYKNPRKPDLWYDPEDVFRAWDLFIEASDGFTNSSLFRYDLVDVSRQSLQIIGAFIYNKTITAANLNNITEFYTYAERLLWLLDDLETLLQTDVHFLMGKWISDARIAGVTEAEKDLYEVNMRNQVTTWGPKGQLIDYANRQFAGLMKFYYKPRWTLFLARLNDALVTGKPFSDNQYDEEVLEKVEIPFTYSKTSMSTTPIGDQIKTAREIHTKYRPLTTWFRSDFSKMYNLNGN